MSWQKLHVRRSAAIYSLLGIAKLNGIDPEAYLQKFWTFAWHAFGNPSNEAGGL